MRQMEPESLLTVPPPKPALSGLPPDFCMREKCKHLVQSAVSLGAASSKPEAASSFPSRTGPNM